LGAGAVLWHGARETEHLVVGGPWIAAVAAMLGAGWLSERREFRGLLLGLGLGVIALLFARSAVQVWVDHPQTVAHYEANREQMLAAQGWAPGSPQALMYERRLRQPDATAWFGLSNVLATFAAAAVVFGLTTLPLVRGRVTRCAMLVLGGLGLALLWMTGSKGGWGAVAIGGLVAGAFVLSGRRRLGIRWRGALPLAAALGVLVVVVLRGLVGERLGELSLLFRAQYLEAAARIFTQHPLYGVGPAGFQEAYLLAKNPLNPEEITSPHSVMFDWLATLGLAGLPWVWLLLRRGWSVAEAPEAAAMTERATSSTKRLGPVAVRIAVLLPVVLFATSAWFEQAMLLPLEIGARALGVVGWVGLTLVIAGFVGEDRPARLAPALIATGATLFAHAQIELTPVHAGSAPLLLLLIGTLWSGSSSSRAGLFQGGPSRVVGPTVLVGVAVAMGLIGVRPLIDWERHLHAAAEPLIQAGRVLRLDPNQPNERLLGPARRAAIEELGRAVDARPGHRETRIEASRLSLRKAVETPGEAARWLDAARGWARGPGDRAVDVRSLRWLAVIDRVAVEEGLEADPEATRGRQIDLLLAAHELDPYNAALAGQLAETYQRMGETAEAANWAGRALELDENLRLDPLKGFTAEERGRLRELAGGG